MMKRFIGCELSTYKDMKKQWDKHQDSIINMASLLTSCNSPARIRHHQELQRNLSSNHEHHLDVQRKRIQEGNLFMLARIKHARSTINFREFEADRRRQLRIIETGAKFSKNRTQVKF